MDPDARHLARLAERLAARLAARNSGGAPAARPGPLLRPVFLAWQAVTRRTRCLVREHWDVAVFDLGFGSLKAFGVYPALYFAGLAWTIPLMEYAPLNTQLWTAGYLLLRGSLLSELGRRRYGVPLERLDALRDRLLDLRPRDARHLHRFGLDGAPRLLRVRHSRWRAWLARRRGRCEAGVVLQSDLRAWVDDPELRFRANPLRSNPYLYERVLLAKLLATPEAHAGLRAASVPEEPGGEERRALQAVLGGIPVTTLARLIEQADSLRAALRVRLGGSAGARALRGVHASLCRAVRARLRVLQDLEYRLLADHLGGGALRTSPHWRALCAARAGVRAALARAGRLARLGAQVRGDAEARSLVRGAIGEARGRGLRMRRARLAAWLADVAARPVLDAQVGGA